MAEPVPASGSVTGRVHTADGWPLPHAIVTVTDTAGRQAARALAGDDGGFAATPLAAGAYTVIVSAAGYQPVARTAVVGAGTHQPTALGVLALAREGGAVLPESGVWTIDPVHSSVQATALHLGITNITGRFADFSGRIVVAEPPEESSVEATIRADSIATHSSDRDAHLRSSDFLDVERFPAITYASESVQRLGPETWEVIGTLSMRGVSRPVPLHLTYRGSGPDLWGGTRAGFTATTELARDDFAMVWNQAVATGVSAFGRTLRVDIDIQAVREG